jgi:hypothetical protein
MGGIKQLAVRIKHPVLATTGWLAFVAGHALSGLPCLAKLGLLVAARVLPSGLRCRSGVQPFFLARNSPTCFGSFAC